MLFRHPKSIWVLNKRILHIRAWNMTRLSASLVLAVFVTAVMALSVSADQQQMFGRPFPELPPYNVPTNAALDALTGAGGSPLDGGTSGGNNPDGLRAFFTYFGRSVDHDMTLDSLPSPADFVDPNTIPNDRDQRLADAAEVIVATYNMENGAMPGSPDSTAYRAKVPIELLQESNGNHFIRITGSPEDQFSTAGSRSEVNLANIPAWCSNSAHRSMTLEMSVRMPNDSTRPSNTGVLQFFQYGGNQYGPTLRLLWNEKKGFYLRKQTSDDPLAGTYPVGSTSYVEEYEEIRLGRVGIGEWVHFEISVYWTLDAAQGVISVWVDGLFKGAMRGQTIKNVKSNCTSDSRIGTYSGAGVVDFDNLEMRVGASGPTPPSSKFRIGDRVFVDSGPVAYRSTPAGTESGTQALNAQGTVVGGPIYASLSGVKHWLWNIKFDNGFPGWVTEGPLQRARRPRLALHLLRATSRPTTPSTPPIFSLR